MDEMTNEVVETAEEVVDQELDTSAFDAVLDSDDDDFWGGDEEVVEQDVTEEADQPTEEQTETEGETEPAEEKPAEEEDADQYLELKHFDEVKKVSKEEAKVLAQKGMDYDRIRGKLTEAEANNAKMARYEEFFNEVRGEMSVEDLIADTLARVRADRNGTDYETEKAKQQAANQQQAQSQAPDPNAIYEAMRKQSFEQFINVYPNVKATEIPQEVWDDMHVTNNLVASYAKYEAKKLAEENKVLKQNATNKARSVGSMKSSGKGSYEKSEFDRVLDDDEY